MAKRYPESFKLQAVEKVLNRSSETTIEEVLSSLGVSRSAMGRWLNEAKANKVGSSSKNMTQEKRPQDITPQERLNHIKQCSHLDEEAISRYCREHGIYPHHIEQWEQDFIQGYQQNSGSVNKSELRNKSIEIKDLKKEILRKDKALAETAALLVLQKKVHEIWEKDEDN